jgi:unsaturated rhamnogalacturonyl hydrolase
MENKFRHVFFVLGLGILSLSLVSCATKTTPGTHAASGVTPLQWSRRMADSEMARLGNTLDWRPEGKAKWSYTTGLFTLALLKLNAVAPEARYANFADNAIGSFITADGNIRGYRPDEYQLDALNSGKTVLALWQLTHDERYRKAAARLREQLDTQPRTPEGGFWHKERYTNQMWLDGLYMADPFYAEYTKMFHGPAAAFDDVARQFELIDEHTYDPQTGLFYHAWDALKVQPWANPVTGCSSNFWGRAVGWYAMALVDVLDYFPASHPARPKLIAILRKLAASVVQYQDPNTGLWWQVLDQAGRKGNYQEATASAMFVYALAKGVNRGYLSRKYVPAIEQGYAGILQHLVKSDGAHGWSLTECCSVAGLGFKNSAGIPRDGSFQYYVSEPVVENDLKGIGPLILAGIEVQQLQQTRDE